MEALSFKERLTQAARLDILLELGRQVGNQLPIKALELVLEAEGYTEHSPEWIESELDFLQRQRVVELITVGENPKPRLVKLTAHGRAFLKRRVRVGGIKRPELEVDFGD